MGSRFVNLTPHSVNVFRDGKNIRFPSLGSVRVPEKKCLNFKVNDIPIYEVLFQYNEIEFPSPAELGLKNFDDVIFIVSAQTKAALKSCVNYAHLQLVSPCDLVRNELGEVIGCSSFCQ